jgi:hypothetical protein
VKGRLTRPKELEGNFHRSNSLIKNFNHKLFVKGSLRVISI